MNKLNLPEIFLSLLEKKYDVKKVKSKMYVDNIFV